MINNKNLNPIVTALFIRGRKLNISIFFISQSYFRVSKDFRLNFTQLFIMKISNKRKLRQIASNHSAEKYSTEPYSFLVNDATLPSDNHLRFRKNLFE